MTLAPLGVAALGGWTVWQCVNFALSPGVPIHIEYDTEAGHARVVAQSFQIDPWKMTAVLKDVRLRTPSGFQVAQLRNLEANYRGGRIFLKIDQVQGQVVRNKKGQFNVVSLLPKQDPKNKGPVTSVEVGQATVKYLDETQANPITRNININGLKVIQNDSKSLIRSKITVEDEQRANVLVQIDENGRYWVRLDDMSGDFGSLLPVVNAYLDKRAMSEFYPVTASSFRPTGEIEVAGDGSQNFTTKGELTIRGQRLQIGKDSIDSLDLKIGSNGKNNVLRTHFLASGLKGDFQGTVSENWKDFSGQYAADLDGKRWPQRLHKLLPKSMNFTRLLSKGSISFVKNRLVANGSLKLAHGEYAKEFVKNLTGRYVVDSNQALIKVDQAIWRGQPIFGAILSHYKNQTLQGVFASKESDLKPLFRLAGLESMSGRGQAKALVSGSYKSPKVELYARGKVAYQGEEENINLGDFDIHANLVGQTAKFDRFVLSGSHGIVSAKGKIDLSSQNISAQLTGGAIPLASFHDDLSGSAFARANVSGSLKDPKYDARIEVYGPRFKDRGVAQAIGLIHGSKDRTIVDRLTLLSGTGKAEANGEIDFKEKVVIGKFSGTKIALSEILNDESYGTFDLENGVISGKLDAIKAVADFQSKKATIFGTVIDSATGRVSLDGDRIALENGIAQLYGGQVLASGHYDISDERGEIQSKVEKIDLGQSSLSTPDFNLGGLVDGSVTLNTKSGNWSGKGSFQLEKLGLNGTPIGAGNLEFSAENNAVKLSGDVGSIDRFISISDLGYDTNSKGIHAELSAYNLELNDIIDASRPYWSQSWASAPSWFSETTGIVSGSATFDYRNEKLKVKQTDLQVENLFLAGRSAGKLQALLDREDDIWNLKKFSWNSDGSLITGQGFLADSGEMNMTASATEFDLSWLRALDSHLPFLTGHASATVVASGSKNDPSGRASLLVDHAVLTNETGDKTSDPLQLSLDDISFGNGRAEVGGQATYSGFTGKITANLPYSAFESNAVRHRDPLSAEIVFSDRPIQDFKDQLTAIDYEKSEGKLGLSASIFGFLDDLKVNAKGRLTAPHLALKNSDTEFENVQVNYDQIDRKSTIDVSAESNRGGALKAQLNANLAHVFGSDFDLDALLDDTSVTGNVKAERFSIAQKIPGAKDPTFAKVNGDVRIGGTLRNPVFTGQTAVDSLLVRLPADPIVGAATALAIEPKFDNIKVSVSSGSKFETGLGPLVVRGQGVINGTLTNPDLVLPLSLENGKFQLPSGRISLDPGGQINIIFTSIGASDPVARVELDLEGRTTVLARSSTGQFEPYVVSLSIQGNALDEKNLRVSAVSDPPDLSQDEILALIGQRDLIQGLAQGDTSRLREAVYSLAIPSFSQGFTQGLATGLKLDYLSVDYNAFDQVVLSAGKTIGKGLILEAMRQLQSNGVDPLRYEVKLVYRLPVADRFLSRVRLGLGFNQSVPIRFSISWSKKF